MNKDYSVDTNALADIARRSGDKTIKSISLRLGIDRNIISGILANKRKPSSNFMYTFVKKYNVDPKTAGIIFFNRNLRNTKVSGGESNDHIA